MVPSSRSMAMHGSRLDRDRVKNCWGLCPHVPTAGFYFRYVVRKLLDKGKYEGANKPVVYGRILGNFHERRPWASKAVPW